MAELPPSQPPGGEGPRRPEPRATEPLGSIIERFRGTPWDSGSGPAPPPANPLAPLLLVVGVVGLLVAGVFVVVNLPRPGPTPAPSRVIFTPPPTPGPGDLIEAAFWRYIGKPAFNYHETIAVAATIDKHQLSQTLSLDVYADDLGGTVDFAIKGQIKPIHLILLGSGGALYARLRASDPWIDANTLGQPAIRLRPFLSLDDPRQLAYAGTTERDGVTLHRLLSTELYRPAVTRVFPTAYLTAPTAQIALELLVTADGEPVQAQFTLHIPADPANGTSAVDATATYEFTNQGKVEPIPTPRL